jgi:hypothetical protein
MGTELFVLAEALGVGSFILASSIEEVRQQDDIAGLRDALAEFEQGGPNAATVHVDQHSGPRALAGVGLEDRGLGLAVSGFDLRYASGHDNSCIVDIMNPVQDPRRELRQPLLQ